MSGNGAPTNFATNQGGGTLPWGSYYGDTPQNSVGSNVMMQQGQYTPYTTPNWITQGLTTSSAPLQSIGMNDYGVWNSAPGMQTVNQYGPNATTQANQSATNWNPPSSLYPNYGNAPYLGGPSPYGGPGGNFNGPGGPPPPGGGTPGGGAAGGAGGGSNPYLQQQNQNGMGSRAQNWQPSQGFAGLGSAAAQRNPAIESAMESAWTAAKGNPNAQYALYNQNPGLFGNLAFRQFSGINNNFINAADYGNASQNQSAGKYMGLLTPGSVSQMTGASTGPGTPTTTSPYVKDPTTGKMVFNKAFNNG